MFHTSSGNTGKVKNAENWNSLLLCNNLFFCRQFLLFIMKFALPLNETQVYYFCMCSFHRKCILRKPSNSDPFIHVIVIGCKIYSRHFLYVCVRVSVSVVSKQKFNETKICFLKCIITFETLPILIVDVFFPLRFHLKCRQGEIEQLDLNIDWSDFWNVKKRILQLSTWNSNYPLVGFMFDEIKIMFYRSLLPSTIHQYRSRSSTI